MKAPPFLILFPARSAPPSQLVKENGTPITRETKGEC